MGIFDKLKEPVFLKESSDAVRQLEALKALEPSLNDDGRMKIAQDIKMLESGIYGENNIAFELRNSHFPMYVLHDVYYEHNGTSAQIDYMVFTRKVCFVIECKNLIGDIEINSNGDFIRTTEFAGKKRKEGIYSPITQNQRHMSLIRALREDKASNFLFKMMAANNFENSFKSIVVLANPKTVLNNRYAPKALKSEVIKADQLIKYIKDVYGSLKTSEMSDKDLKEWAEKYATYHQEKQSDYTSRYQQYIKVEESTETVQEIHLEVVRQADPMPVEESEVFKALKAYRLERSRKENIKAYMIYNDKQLIQLIDLNPEQKNHLAQLSWWTEDKMMKYGADIMIIINENRWQ